MAIRIPIEILELESENYHILVTSVFDDGESGKWVVDTGASKSVFDKRLQEYIEHVEGSIEDLHSAGFGEEPMKGQIAKLKPFSFSGFKIRDMKVAILDLTHINKLYATNTNIVICGLLGSDFLLKHKAVIDYKRKQIFLKKVKRN